MLQERSFKLAAARALAQEAAAFHSSGKTLRQTARGDEMRKAAAQVGSGIISIIQQMEIVFGK